MTCVENRPIYGAVTTNTPAWSGGARSNIQFSGNCYYGFEVTRASVGVVCGLNNSDDSPGYLEIDHGLYFTRGTVTVWENGLQRGPAAHSYVEGAKFYIVRIGADVLYCERPAGAASTLFFSYLRYPGYKFPGAIIYASVRPSYGQVFLDSSLYAVGDTIFHEVAGTQWYPGSDDLESIDPASATIDGVLPLDGLASGAGTATYISGEMPFEVLAHGTHLTGINGVLPLSGLIADIPLNTLIIGDLPLAGYADSGGVYLALEGIMGALGFGISMGCSSHEVEIEGELPFAMMAIGVDDDDVVPSAIIHGALPLSGFTSSVFNSENYFRIMLTFNEVSASEGGGVAMITDTFYAQAVMRLNYANLVSEHFRATSKAQTFYHPTTTVVSKLSAKDMLKTKLVTQLVSTLHAADAVTYVQVVRLADALHARGAVESFYHGVVSVLSAVVIRDSIVRAESASVQDTITAGDELEYQLKQLAELLDVFTITDTQELVLTVVIEEVSEFQAQDMLELTSHLFAELVDQVEVVAILKSPSDIAQGWVMNTEAAMPISEYDNFEFASLAYFDGVLYGASDTGLYQMGADDDEGEPITAELASMFLDMGTSRMKRIRSAYMGYTSTNELVLKVRSVKDGQLSEHWYKATGATADAPERARMRVGQGLKSRYWQFELTNVDGGDFEVDQIELHPIFLGRRV